MTKPDPKKRVKTLLSLSPESARQLEQLKKRIFGGNSAVVATCIAEKHAQMKKESPDDFS